MQGLTCPSHGREKFVLKDIPQNIFSNFNARIWPHLRQNPSPKILLPIDTIPGSRTYVYQYLQSDLFNLVRDNISMRARRQILKRTLQAIADLHYQDVVHLGTTH